MVLKKLLTAQLGRRECQSIDAIFDVYKLSQLIWKIFWMKRVDVVYNGVVAENVSVP